jgi:energy-coupling factor transporter ATP-binding protein EcfA2
VSTKIKDLVEIIPVRNPSQETQSGPESALSSFLMTYEIGDALTRVVERVGVATSAPRNCLIVGSSGCGKTTLLAAAANLLRCELDTPLDHSRLVELRASVGRVRTHVVRVGARGPERSLAAAVERATLDHALEHGLPGGEPGSIAQLDLLASAAAAMPDGNRILVAVDDLDDWLRGAGRFAFENLQTLVRLGELSRRLPVSTCAVAGSGVLSDEASAADGRGWMAALHADFQIEYLPSHIIRTATANHVLRKHARQRREILEVLGRLREKLPELSYGDEEFIELYPLEVSTWTIGGHLHRWIPGFSFPVFAARAAESVKGRPSSSLFALNDMFTRYEATLRRVDSLGAIFAIYDGLVADAVPQLGQSQRLWATLALQSIFMHTIAGITVDVITLTNSVLLYSLHGNGSSYVFMAAVLKQLEPLARGKIVASGEGSARRYGLVAGQREAVLARVDELADTVEDEDELTWAMLAFGGHVFADWPFALGSVASVRSSVWDVSLDRGAVTLRPAGLGADAESDRPSLVVFAPGRTWSEAHEEATTSPSVVCWIGAATTPAATQALKKWIAVSRLSDDERYTRFADVAELRAELERQAAAVFRRTYVERGTLVSAGRSEPVDALVHASREENLVARFLPAEVVSRTPLAAGSASVPANGDVPFEDARWLAVLTASRRDEIDVLAAERVGAAWLKRLKAWYAAGVGRDLSVPAARFGGKPLDVPQIAGALEAKQQLDVALFTVRKALSASDVGSLRESLESVFVTDDMLWAARERVDWLEQFGAFLGTVGRAERYLHEAVGIEDPDVEALRRSLLEWIGRPEDFVDGRRREAFADSFSAFRDEYASTYVAEHERGVGPEVIDRLSHALIESSPWRALEALSSLPIGNPSYLVEATNLISMLREARCGGDVRAALAEWPRCSCGFRFGDRARIAALASSAAELIQSGIKHHRRLLQMRRHELRAKLKARKAAYDLETIKAIAALTSEDALPEIGELTLAALRDLLDSRVG